LHDIEFSEDEDVLSVASLLKRYFNLMTFPITTYDLYTSFVAANSESDKQMRKFEITTCLQLMPENNVRILENLCKFLHEVHQNSHINKMNARNLAILFSPNLLRPLQDNLTKLISDAGHKTAVIEALIVDVHSLFSNASISNPQADHFKEVLSYRYSLHSTITEKVLEKLRTEKQLNDQEFEEKLVILSKKIKEGEEKTLNKYFENIYLEPEAPKSTTDSELKTEQLWFDDIKETRTNNVNENLRPRTPSILVLADIFDGTFGTTSLSQTTPTQTTEIKEEKL